MRIIAPKVGITIIQFSPRPIAPVAERSRPRRNMMHKVDPLTAAAAAAASTAAAVVGPFVAVEHLKWVDDDRHWFLRQRPFLNNFNESGKLGYCVGIVCHRSAGATKQWARLPVSHSL